MGACEHGANVTNRDHHLKLETQRRNCNEIFYVPTHAQNTHLLSEDSLHELCLAWRAARATQSLGGSALHEAKPIYVSSRVPVASSNLSSSSWLPSSLRATMESENQQPAPRPAAAEANRMTTTSKEQSRVFLSKLSKLELAENELIKYNEIPYKFSPCDRQVHSTPFHCCISYQGTRVSWKWDQRYSFA